MLLKSIGAQMIAMKQKAKNGQTGVRIIIYPTKEKERILDIAEFEFDPDLEYSYPTFIKSRGGLAAHVRQWIEMNRDNYFEFEYMKLRE